MAKKNSPPCIRNLPVFKKGCPEKCWDGEEGCPCWIELPVSKKGNPLEQEIRKQCIDLWTFEFQWAQMGQNEARINLSERLNNGLLMEDENGKIVPKPDMLMFNVLKATFKPNQQAIENAAKKINDNNLIDI